MFVLRWEKNEIWTHPSPNDSAVGYWLRVWQITDISQAMTFPTKKEAITHIQTWDDSVRQFIKVMPIDKLKREMIKYALTEEG